MRAQTEAALIDCDAILFVIDARAGLTAADRHFAQAVRRADKPIIVIANKAESNAGKAGVYEAFSLGLGEPIAFSAEHGEGLSELYDALVEVLPAAARLDPDEESEAAPLILAKRRTAANSIPPSPCASPCSGARTRASRPSSTASSARIAC